MNRKILSIVSIAAISILVAVLFLFPVFTPEPAGKITAYFHLYSSPAKEELEKLLLDFTRAYPEIELDYRIGPYLDIQSEKARMLAGSPLERDHVVVSSAVRGDISEGDTISPGLWTGTEWNLFYNSRVLSDLDLSEDTLQEERQKGLSGFIEGVSSYLKPGQTLFAVSSRYHMQRLSWLQHLELEQHSGTMPESFSPDEWRYSINAFTGLVETGYINSDHAEINEASTALRMFKGEALFVLETDAIYSIFLPGDRRYIRSLRFPGSVEQGWVVGSGFYLALTEPENIERGTAEAVRVFIEYLRSEKVIDQMLQTAGIKINPPRPTTMMNEIPSISSRVRDAALQPLIDSD